MTLQENGKEKVRLIEGNEPSWLVVGRVLPPLPEEPEVINGGCDECNAALALAAAKGFVVTGGVCCGHCGYLRRGPVLTLFERLAEAAEHLLAEYGVTEPGAGVDNHEGPAGAALDALYAAWNEYMRAKHGTPDAVFEPEDLHERIRAAELECGLWVDAVERLRKMEAKND